MAEDTNVGDGSTGENPDIAQPTHFDFDDESRTPIDAHCAKYPAGPPGQRRDRRCLYEVQNQMRRQTGSAWVPRVAMDAVRIAWAWPRSASTRSAPST